MKDKAVALEDLLTPEFIVGVIVLLFVVIVVASGIRVIREWERAPVLRLGRYTGLKGPGLFYIIPFVDRIPNIVSTRVQTFPFRTEQTFTKDNVPVNVDAIMFFQAIDVEKVILNVERYLDATTLAAQTTLREVIGKVSFDELLAEREKVGVEARNIIDMKTEHWGIKVSSVEVKDIGIPGALQDAMSRQAQAERERRARVTLAMAEYEAAQKMVDAANMYEKNIRALELRWMNILYELGLQSKGTLMLVPTNTPTAGVSMGFPPLGVVSIQDLAKQKKDEKT
ncbi:MAG TPA: SPFH domain-containing protein [Candidatus Acidoferrales bacterium]|nr:SPFH domain-containing protein [Candidatus Acidoferrales bacterium]